MEYTVAEIGMSWGTSRMFVCDDEGRIVVKVWGADQEDAERKAEVIADALMVAKEEEEDAAERTVPNAPKCSDCGHEAHRGKCFGAGPNARRWCPCYKEAS